MKKLSKSVENKIFNKGQKIDAKRERAKSLLLKLKK